MEYNEYLRRYNWRIRRLTNLGVLYPRKGWWRLSKYNKVEWRKNQLNDMLATIYEIMIRQREAQRQAEKEVVE